jgi:hypothetical protein
VEEEEVSRDVADEQWEAEKKDEAMRHSRQRREGGRNGEEWGDSRAYSSVSRRQLMATYGRVTDLDRETGCTFP